MHVCRQYMKIKQRWYSRLSILLRFKVASLMVYHTEICWMVLILYSSQYYMESHSIYQKPDDFTSSCKLITFWIKRSYNQTITSLSLTVSKEKLLLLIFIRSIKTKWFRSTNTNEVAYKDCKFKSMVDWGMEEIGKWQIGMSRR